MPLGENLTASADATFVNAFSGASIFGLVLLMIAGFALVALAYTPLFKLLRQRGKRVFKIFYYFFIGIPAVIGGYSIYKVGVWISYWAGDSGITWADVGKGIGAFALVSVIGYVSEKVYRRILDNFAKARNGELNLELEK